MPCGRPRTGRPGARSSLVLLPNASKVAVVQRDVARHALVLESGDDPLRRDDVEVDASESVPVRRPGDVDDAP